MLTRFCVENFKNFRERFVWDLTDTSNYIFQSQIISRGCITKGLIYGPNGSGKSNLGLALFDIIFHLTDKQKIDVKYLNYLNLDSMKSYASFEYEFLFEGVKLVYRYTKTDVYTLRDEHLFIDGREVIYYDFTGKEGFVHWDGEETLRLGAGKPPVSWVKFLKNSVRPTDSAEKRAFYRLTNYVNNMLLFFSLGQKGYEGFHIGGGNIAEEIINSGNIKNFESFLREKGLDYQLVSREVDGHRNIYCSFQKGEANLFSVMSSGEAALALFYYWYLKMKYASFVYIDEFDAFYHYELASELVRMVRDLQKCQVFLSTHNTDLMSNTLLRPDGYFILDKKGIHSMAQLTKKEIRKAHNLQKMYKDGVFCSGE